MLRVYINTHHVKIIDDFLTSNNMEHESFTINNLPKDELKPLDLGVSYQFQRMVES